jgi:hypothetical protein
MRERELPQEGKSKQRRKCAGSGVLVRLGDSGNAVILVTIKRNSEDRAKILD